MNVTIGRTHSIVLLAVCDAYYTFTTIDIGIYRPQSDGDIMCLSKIGKCLVQNELDVPDTNVITCINIELPRYLVSDGAFRLRDNIIRAYPGILLAQEEKTFNKKLPHVKRTIENAFSSLESIRRMPYSHAFRKCCSSGKG
uniref:DDE Tnp4 domain-containing protein n=1 Tax=Glossina austeni TaxID=7395 RepID=A0A1A9UXJ1_GLOAU